MAKRDQKISDKELVRALFSKRVRKALKDMVLAERGHGRKRRRKARR
jgi:hypothetical protein